MSRGAPSGDLPAREAPYDEPAREAPYDEPAREAPYDEPARETTYDDLPEDLKGDLPADLSTPWRRLDPRMLLVHPVQEVIRFIPALIGAVIVGQSQDSGGQWVELAVLAAAVAVGVLRWATTRFRIEDDQIELRKGLFTKQLVATPADRVRTVDVTAPPFHRLLRLAKVEIGTAGTSHDRLVLDALPLAQARRMREELIHRRRVLAPGSLPAPSGEPVDLPPPDPSSGVGDSLPGTETQLLRLDPRWMLFAPLTLSGVFSALAIFGFANQFVQRYLERTDLEGTVSSLGSHPLWLDVAAGLVGLVVLVSALAVIGYALQFWGFRLTRHSGGTLHVTRGLLTTRETSVEEKRLRGVELGQPLGLRLARGARLQAITTGLSRKETDRGSAWLSPPAPRAVVDAVAAEVVDDVDALTAPLSPHGPAARRRRWTRALWPALVVAVAGWVVVRWLDLPVWVGVLTSLPVLTVPSLAADRYAGLGHHLSADHLVVQQGTFVRRRDVLAREGVIGWRVHQSFFQRRVGLAHVIATTAAGKQSYTAYDVPLDDGVALAVAVDPELLGPFLER